MPVLAGRAHLYSAQLAAGDADFHTATRHIAQALSRFRETGANALHGEAIALRRKLAGQQAAATGVSLTRRERQVAEMAARGLTNKQIASELFVSPRTVEDHVGRAIRKLGVPNRAAIASQLGRS
ncbi:MAG: hypothetical protein GX542_06095 [Rhodococcus sp.]|nr:hypothetical protein [Rhodococcus sp. (in: high G+C Gram-positive bacteria)]